MQPKFSANSIALGNIRSRRRQYALLIAAIVLAVYFTATAFLLASTMSTSLRERNYDRLGEQDATIFNCREAPLEGLLANGAFSEYGIAEILGFVIPDEQNEANGFSIARFDEAAITIARKDPIEGRLPIKEGEIALERSALARLRTNAGVGDTIILTLQIPDGTGFMDSPVEKRYTLVGILSDKLTYLNRWNTAVPAYRDFPAGVLAAEEQIEAGGRAIVNCYGRYAQDAAASFEQLKAFCLENGIAAKNSIMLDIYTSRMIAGNYNDSQIIVTSVFFMVIAVVLVLAACLGIVNAFSADLESRKRQIGLFRAVGATKRQIRDIFGRETLLLSVFSIPPALTLACLTVWGITAVLGDHYLFRPDAPVLIAVAAAGVLCVIPAAAIPLRKAAKIPPMQAIRDVELSRKIKQNKVKSKPLFDVPRLIARRSLTLYKNKQAGITIMLAVSIVLLSLVAFGAAPLIDEAAWDYGSDYRLFNQGRMLDWLMEYELRKPRITEQDRADAAALATVKSVIGEKVLSVKILADRVTPYILGVRSWRFDYLSPEPQRVTPSDYPESRQRLERQHNDYLASKAKYGYTQDYLTVDCCAIDAAVLEKLSPFVSAGRINLEKISSGEEILVVAPAEYGYYEEEYEDGHGWSSRIDYTLDSDLDYNYVHQNDFFRAGDTVTLSLLYTDERGEHPDGPQEYNEDGSRILPDNVERVDRTVTIGAILEPYASEKYLASYFFSYFYPETGDIITTTAGLHALGFDLPYTSLSITLSESPDAALEEYLETNLAQIAARTAGVEMLSYVAIARENREMVYGLLIAAGAVLLLFFAICASMINNALSARICASKREIGTIRAVGASEREIARSYLWQLISMFAWGTATGMGAQLALCGWLLIREHIAASAASLPVWQPLLFVALLFGICYLNVRSKVGSIFRGSVVENIREL